MTTLKEINRCGEELEYLLVLKTSPLAIKMLQKEEDIPEGALRPKKDRDIHLAQCQAFAMSRRQRLSIAMLKEDHWCWAPLAGYGLVDASHLENFEATRYQARILPRLESGKYLGLVSAPLKTANFEPDLILIYCSPAQLRSLMMVIKHKERELVSSVFDPIDSCVYDIVPVLQTGQYRITLPDPGEFHRAMAGEDEIIFSAPARKIEGLVAGLRDLEKMHLGYRDASLEMRPDFPRPEFYRKLFEAWGLDQEKQDHRPTGTP